MTLGEKIKGFNRGWLWLILVAVALFGGGVAVGRFTLPAKVVVTEKVKEVVKEVVVEKVKTEVKVVVEKVYLKNEAQKIHRVVEEKPDGTKVTTENINVESVVKENTNSNTVEVKYVDRVVEKWQEKIVEKEKRVLNQPDWSVYAGVGVNIPTFLGHAQPGVPGMMGTVVDAGIDRRVVGPFWLGVYGTTQGDAGIKLRVTW